MSAGRVIATIRDLLMIAIMLTAIFVGARFVLASHAPSEPLTPAPAQPCLTAGYSPECGQ